MACTREFVILREGAGYRLHHFSAMAPSISQRPEERFGATMETFAPLVALTTLSFGRRLQRFLKLAIPRCRLE